MVKTDYTVTNLYRADPHGPYVYTFEGKSTMTKPTGGNIATGSTCYDIDTQEAYKYDADTENWV